MQAGHEVSFERAVVEGRLARQRARPLAEAGRLGRLEVLGFVADGHPDRGRPEGRGLDPGEHPDEGCLARRVRAHDPDRFPLCDPTRSDAEVELGEALLELRELDEGVLASGGLGRMGDEPHGLGPEAGRSRP